MSPLNVKLILHRYMKRDNDGFYRLFYHGYTREHFLYSPCPKCDHKTILLAKNVRSLHLDFGDSYHCIMPIIEQTCSIAIREMPLERLVVTISNIWSYQTCRYLSRLIWKVNNATQETGRLLSVSSKAFSPGPTWADFGSESWFWQTTGGRKVMTWVDDWNKKRADDAAAIERLYGKSKAVTTSGYVIFIDSDTEDADATAADATDTDTADADAADADVADVDTADGETEDVSAADANSADGEAENAPLGDDFSDLSDPDESLFPEWIPTP